MTAANGQDSPPTRDQEPALSLPAGWTTVAPRDEIRPVFSFEPKGGPNKAGSFVVSHDHREGLDGWFQKSFAVQGGEFYRFHAARKTDNVDVPRRSALVRVLWQDEAGEHGVRRRSGPARSRNWATSRAAEPEHPDGRRDR